jgi:general secretion pathway protein G
MRRMRGFTLVELIVVIAIIALLSAIVAPNAFHAIEKSKIAKMALDLKTLKTSWLALYSDTGRFPNEGQYVAAGYPNTPNPGVLIPNTDIARNVLNLPGWNGPYLQGRAVSPWVAPYRYDNEAGGIGTCYNPQTGANPYTGVNVGLNEGEFSASQQTLIPKIDRIIDDGDGVRGSLRYTNDPSKRIFYMVYPCNTG